MLKMSRKIKARLPFWNAICEHCDINKVGKYNMM